MGEERQVRNSRPRDDQDPPEEGDQGREARGLRQSCHGEGKAGQNRREGFPREGPQGRVLRACPSSRSPDGEAPRVLLLVLPPLLLLLLLPPSLSEESSCHSVQACWRVRGQAWPPGPRALCEGDRVYSTSASQRK